MTEKPDAAVIAKLKEEAERKYPRKLGVLARRLQWSRGKLSKILTGEQEAKLNELMTICALLGVPLSQLLQRVGA